MKKIKDVSLKVKRILEEIPETRDDDDLLYTYVCKEINADYLGISFEAFLQSRKMLGYPPFETVRRARQKMQAQYPELASTLEVRIKRAEKETEYREYARS